MADRELAGAIRAVLADSPFHGEGHRKVWARLRLRAVRTSRRRVLRLMRQHGLLAPSRAGSPRGPRNHDGTVIPDAVDTTWSTDMTTTWTGEGQAAVFIAVDHHSAECVGIHAARRGTHFEALEPTRQAIRHGFGAFAEGIAAGPAVRHDHGSQYMSDDFQKEIALLGIESSPAFVRAPEGDRCTERFIHAPQGEPALGSDLRHRRASPSGAYRVLRCLQRNLAPRATWLPAIRRHPRPRSY